MMYYSALRAVRLMRVLLSIVIVALVAACGGGGGGGGGGSSGSGGNGPRFSLSTNRITFSALSAGAYVAPQTVTATVAGITGGTLYFNVVSTGPAVQSVSDISITSSTTGQATIYPANSATLGTGSYSSRISVTACLNDPTCATGQLGGSPQIIDVTYVVGGIIAAPSAVNLSAIEGATPSAVDVGVTAQSSTGALTTSVAYTGSASGWLTISPPTSTSLPATLRLSAASLPAGNYSAIVTLTSGGYSLPLPVNCTVRPSLGLSSSALSFAAKSGQATLPTAQNIDVASATGATTYTPSVTYGTGASNWLNVSGSAAPGTLSVAPNTTTLTPGTTYTARVSLAPAGGGSPASFDVSYAVGSSTLTLTPTPLAFSLNAASAPTDAFLKRTIATGDTGAPLSWTATSSVPWLSVTPNGVSGDAATVALVTSALKPLSTGVSNGSINFTFNGSGVSATTVTVPVSLNLNLPKIDYVAPYVAVANRAESVILRGSGFNSLAGQAISFGSTAVTDYTVVSDSEIRLTHPALAAGNYPLHIGSGSSIDFSSATLVSVIPPTFAGTTLTYPNSAAKQPLQLVYDSERKALLVAVVYPSAGSGGSLIPSAGSSGDIFRYTNNGTNWSATPTSQYVPTFRDIGLATDGSKLIAVSDCAVTPLDPVLLSAGTSANLNCATLSIIHFNHMVMTNNGLMLITTGVNGSGSSPLYGYSLRTGTVTPVDGYYNYFYFGSPGASLDGSRAAIIEGGLSPTPPVIRYDASSGSLSSTNLLLNQDYINPPLLDRSGTKVILNGHLVYDGNYNQIGDLPCGGITSAGVEYSVIAPDGTRAYCYNQGTQVLHTYNLTATPVAGMFPEIGTGTNLVGNPGAGATRMVVSPDGGTLFIAGPEAIVVQPVP